MRYGGADEVDGNRCAWKGAVAGVVGGLAASWLMNRFQAGMSKAARSAHPSSEGGRRGSQNDEDATQKAAAAIAEPVLDRRLTKQEKQAASPVIHYAFGSMVGAIYGAVAEIAPRTTTGWGLPFGTAVWLGADEVAVPLFGLSKSPAEYPASTHASALASHLVYGLTTDMVRRAVRAALV